MPIYEYECRDCEHRFERMQKFSDDPVRECPECGGPVERLISAPAIRFKGSGWYVTDYSDKGKATRKEAEAESSKASSESGEKKSSDDGGSSSKADGGKSKAGSSSTDD